MKYFGRSFWRYKDFVRCMIDKFVRVPFAGDNFVPQGVCLVDNFMLITFYDYTGKDKSVVFVVDVDGDGCRMVRLDGKYHCGGIAYHKMSDSVYIAGDSGYVNKYSYRDILVKDQVCAEVKFFVDCDNLLISGVDGKSSVGFLSVYGNYIYVGNFIDDVGKIKRYDLDTCGRIVMDSCIIWNNPYKKTQGFCRCKYRGEDYYLFSTSYGRRNDSFLYISKRVDDEFLMVKKKKMPVLAEQINIGELDEIYIIFESCAFKYSSAKNIVRDVCFLDLERLLY